MPGLSCLFMGVGAFPVLKGPLCVSPPLPHAWVLTFPTVPPGVCPTSEPGTLPILVLELRLQFAQFFLSSVASWGEPEGLG